MFYAYIIKSGQDSSYYIGSCENVEDRLQLHNQGRVKSTKRYLPWDLVYSEKFETRKEARNRELRIKSWKKRSAVEKLIKKFKIENPR